MTKNEIKKDLYKTRQLAKFSHYSMGKLYYDVELQGEFYRFPINTTEKFGDNLRLSSDLGTTTFDRTIEARHLIRWIDQAIDTNEFILIK